MHCSLIKLLSLLFIIKVVLPQLAEELKEQLEDHQMHLL